MDLLYYFSPRMNSSTGFTNIKVKPITDCSTHAKNFLGKLIFVVDLDDIKDFQELINSRIDNNLRIKIVINRTNEMFALDDLKIITPYLSKVPISDILLVTLSMGNIKGTVYDFQNTFNTLYIEAFENNAYDCIMKTKFKLDTTPVKERPLCLNVLFGKLKTRYVRFAATYYLYKHNLLQNALCGLLANVEDIPELFEKYPEFANDDFYNILVNKLGPADDVRLVDFKENGITVYGIAWPFSHTIFKNSSVSYISESTDIYYQNMDILFPSRFSEKAWRPIVSKHPFVIQSVSGTLEHLRSLGYQTFDTIIDESYNDFVEKDWSHIENTVLAAKELLNKIPSHHEQVQEIVDFNYELFLKRGKQNIEALNREIINFSLL